MGRTFRFRLSDIMPNAWFYKLKDMSSKQARSGTRPTHPSTARKSIRNPVTPPRQFPSPIPPPSTPSSSSSSLHRHHIQPLRPGRPSYYFPSGDQDRLLFSPAHQPRKSKKKPRRRLPEPQPQGSKHAAVTSSALGPQCRCQAEAQALLPDYQDPRVYEALEIGYEYDRTAGLKTRRDAGFTVDADSNSQSPSTTTTTTTTETTNTFDAGTEDVDLRPILTKPASDKEPVPVSHLQINNHINPQKKKGISGHRSKRSPPPSLSLGVTLRTRVNSPRLAAASRKAAGMERARRSSAASAAATTPRKSTGRLSGSFAVVKSSSDPRRDFRESMLEMIEENKLWTSNDLEDLLACYLSLNSTEYHDVIIKVFRQIWYDLSNLNNI